MTRGRADFTASESADVLRAAVTRLSEGFEELPPSEARIAGGAEIARLLEEVADRLQNNYPYFHPLYAGQMLKPPHPAARLAYALAMWLNPNNHALDGGRESSRDGEGGGRRDRRDVRLEGAAFLGHLCGGGTMANLEALWVAGRLHPGAAVVASSQAHYTHGRIGSVLGLPFEPIAVRRPRAHGRAGPRAPAGARRRRHRRGDDGHDGHRLGGSAARDPGAPRAPRLPRFMPTRRTAATSGSPTTSRRRRGAPTTASQRSTRSSSIRTSTACSRTDAAACSSAIRPSAASTSTTRPYTYFSSDELHLGEISLECSRPGAAAVALWATQRLLPLQAGGEFAGGLTDCRAAALDFHDALSRDARFLPAFPPELDIVIWIPRAKSASEASARSRRIFEEAARRNLHLALAELPAEFFELERAGIARDRETVTCLRSVLMKPEHREWTPRILAILGEAADASA